VPGKRKRATVRPKAARQLYPGAHADVLLWTEALCGAELVLLHASPVFYGFGVPQGDGSGVVVIPGFLGTDLYLM